MLTIRAMTNAQGYAARHLEHSDYYAEGERVVGQWRGRGAELLALSGPVKSEEFEAIRQGLDPHTGEFLRQRQSADRIAADGTTQSHGRNLYDFTFSAPKSVSVMAGLADDERLAKAHQNAVSEALQELESYASTRHRQPGPRRLSPRHQPRARPPIAYARSGRQPDLRWRRGPLESPASLRYLP